MVLKEPFTQAETLTDEIRLNLDMFIGHSPNGGSEGDIVLTKNFLDLREKFGATSGCGDRNSSRNMTRTSIRCMRLPPQPQFK